MVLYVLYRIVKGSVMSNVPDPEITVRTLPKGEYKRYLVTVAGGHAEITPLPGGSYPVEVRRRKGIVTALRNALPRLEMNKWAGWTVRMFMSGESAKRRDKLFHSTINQKIKRA